jgi:four helix bundle protein
MKDFRELQVWRKAHALTLKVYHEAKKFPREEQYELARQIRRSAASVAANLAEGCGRSTDADLARFADISLGSASETEYHLILSRDLGFLEKDAFTELTSDVVEVKRMLTAYIQYLRRPRPTNPKRRKTSRGD